MIMTTCCQIDILFFMTVKQPHDPLSRLTRSVFLLNGILLKIGEDIARSEGQSVARWHVLARANEQPRSVSDIARYIGISRQGVQRVANDLEREGYVKFAVDKADKRAPLVVLTGQGKSVLKALYKKDRAFSTVFLRSVDGKRMIQTVAGLDEVAARLSREARRLKGDNQ